MLFRKLDGVVVIIVNIFVTIEFILFWFFRFLVVGLEFGLDVFDGKRV